MQVRVDATHDALGVAHDDTVVGYVFVDEGVRTDDYVVADGHADSNRCAVPNLNHPWPVYISRAGLEGWISALRSLTIPREYKFLT